MIQFTQQGLCVDQSVIFCRCRHKMASPHHIWHVSMLHMRNFFDTLPGDIELISISIDFVFLSIILNTSHTNSCVSMILESLAGVLHLPTVVEFPSVTPALCTF